MIAKELKTPPPLVRIVDDEETVRNSELFMFRLAGLEAVAYPTPEDFLDRDDFDVPGCAVIDILMPDMSGMALQRVMQKKGIDLPVIFLTGHGDINMAVSAMRTGAVDFLQKPADPDVLISRVKDCCERSCRRFRRKAEIRERRRLYETLTEREKEVLALVALGELNKVIAGKLGVSEQTVKIHRGSANRKLGIRSSVQARQWLVSLGVLAEEETHDIED